MINELGLVLLLIATAVSITYFIFSIWNLFISKRQVTISLIDFIYWQTASIFGGSFLYDNYGIKGMVALWGIVAIWLSIIMYRCSKNEKDFTK